MADGKTGVNHWLKLSFTALGFVVLSVGLGYLTESLFNHYHIPLDIQTWTAFWLVFGVMALTNLSVLPLPFSVSLLIVAAAHWNPILMTLSGSLGATLGEFSGYFFGRLGKRISIDENTRPYKMVHGWIAKYGMWAIAFLSFQPALPFEIGGFIAGATKMPIQQFLPAIWIGKFPKYLILVYLGTALLHRFPFL